MTSTRAEDRQERTRILGGGKGRERAGGERGGGQREMCRRIEEWQCDYQLSKSEYELSQSEFAGEIEQVVGCFEVEVTKEVLKQE